MVVDVDKKQTEWKPEGQMHNIAKLTDEPYRQILNVGIKKLCLTT